MWIARRGVEIAGVDASIPFSLKVGDNRVRAQWGIDLMVDSRWRGQGIAAELNTALRAASPVSCSLGMSDEGRRHALRNGYTEMGAMAVFAHVIDAARVLATAPLHGLRRPVGFLASGLSLALSKVRHGGAVVQPVNEFDIGANEVWRQAAKHYPVISVRNARTLRWRFDESPQRDQYSRYYVHRSDAIGYFVLRDTTWHDTEVSTMVDYLAAPDMLSDLFAAAVVEARRRNKAALLCTTLNRHANKTLPWLGFVRLPHASYATRFMLRADPSVRAQPVLYDPANWFITAADADIDIAIAGVRRRGT